MHKPVVHQLDGRTRRADIRGMKLALECEHDRGCTSICTNSARSEGLETRDAVEISVPVMFGIVDGEDDARLAAMRSTIAFYGSTPAYRPVLEHHGWGELGGELHRLSTQGEWQKMGTLVEDDVLHTFAVIGDAVHVGKEIARRYGGVVDRIQIGTTSDDDQIGTVIDALRRAPAGSSPTGTATRCSAISR